MTSPMTHVFRLTVALACLTGATICPAQNSKGQKSSVQDMIDAAIRDGQRRVVLPAGVVRVEKGLLIAKAKGLTIEGRQTTLVIGKHKGNGLHFRGCRDITLRGVAIDYDPLPFTQGTVVGSTPDGNGFEFEVHAGYPDLSEEYLIRHVHIFEPNQLRWKREAPDIYARRTEAITPRRGRIVFPAKSKYLSHIRPGDRLVLNMRTGSTIAFNQCENMRVEGVTILAGPGCAVIVRYARGDNRYQFDIRPGPKPAGATQPRLMSTCADGFNYAFARRGPVLENCRFSFMGDDSVNLHGTTFGVVEVVSPTELLIGRPYGPEPYDWLMEPGDVFRTLQPADFAIKGQSTMAALKRERDLRDRYAHKIKGFWPRMRPDSGTVYRLTLQAPLPAQAGDFLDVPSDAAPHFRISGCTFSDHRARGVRVMSSHGVIENNTIRRVKHLGISVGTEYAYWREAGWVKDVVIRNNRIEDVGEAISTCIPTNYVPGAICVFGRTEGRDSVPPFVQGNEKITIENNSIRGCAVAGIYAYAAKHLIVRGNTVSHVLYGDTKTTGTERGLDVKKPIDLRRASDVTEENNHVSEIGVPLGR